MGVATVAQFPSLESVHLEARVDERRKAKDRKGNLVRNPSTIL
tara:strand:+ start:350 stop:478 length:129 start_codon:yes stop_codon:yes gene_type:complete